MERAKSTPYALNLNVSLIESEELTGLFWSIVVCPGTGRCRTYELRWALYGHLWYIDSREIFLDGTGSAKFHC